VLQGIFPLAAPLAAAALALYLGGQLLGALAPVLGHLLPAPPLAGTPAASAGAAGLSGTAGAAAASGAAVPAAPGSAPAGVRNTPAHDLALLEALVGGRHAWLEGAAGAWPRPGREERFRMDDPPRAFTAPTGAAGNALAFTRALLERDHPVVEVLTVRLVMARHLGPEWPGSSVEGGVTAPSEEVLAERPAWLLLARAEDRVPPRTLLELLVVDATTGALLLRPRAVPVDDFDAAAARLAYHPAQDRTRPLNAFGDAAP
jgi:hypothetical protein